jgi:integrase
MGKRANGKGSSYQRQDGRWSGSVTIALEGGKQRRHAVYGKTRREVLAKLRETQRRLLAGEPPGNSHSTVAGFLERWLTEALPAAGLKPTTVENYTILTRRHLIPTLGDKRLEELGAADVQRLLNAKRAEGLSDRTVQLVHAVLRRALGQAVRWQEARRNVAALVDRPRVARREARCLSPEDAQRLLDAARGDRLYAFYAVALACGLRRGEALALRWSDVDLDAGLLRVARTLSRIDRGLAFTEPKSARSRRSVPLPAACVTELRNHRTRQLEEQPAHAPPHLRLAAAVAGRTPAGGDGDPGPLGHHDHHGRLQPRDAATAARGRSGDGRRPALVSPRPLPVAVSFRRSCHGSCQTAYN